MMIPRPTVSPGLSEKQKPITQWELRLNQHQAETRHQMELHHWKGRQQLWDSQEPAMIKMLTASPVLKRYQCPTEKRRQERT
jgi:hypothetical protein